MNAMMERFKTDEWMIVPPELKGLGYVVKNSITNPRPNTGDSLDPKMIYVKPVVGSDGLISYECRGMLNEIDKHQSTEDTCIDSICLYLISGPFAVEWAAKGNIKTFESFLIENYGLSETGPIMKYFHNKF